ncbi:Peroxisomal membrane protein PEX30-like protein [Elsinoe fawcettii]|nr:Peroxisomal membrane protein PEX30-like protein [Elsinoe fawcettii]
MSDPSSSAQGGIDGHNDSRTPQTTAAFSPHNHSSSRQQRSTILLHQKSPLLLATPPQVTRALAYSHAFLIPLNKFVGLLSWTTGDPWESFLFVASFWFTVLYGDVILRYAGPLILVVFLILGMYFRRYSPLSSTGWTGEKSKGHKRSGSDSPVEHRKSLDEILATLQAFTGRCNILLAPMIQMTDFLSTQQTATSATTRPALTTLFIRILFASPLWFLLTLPPLRIITAKRIVFAAGTLVLSWHSRPARISRAILWRSRTVRELASLLTGLNFSPDTPATPRSSSFPPSNLSALSAMKSKSQNIRFTFSLYENQRRWIGLGWTANMVAYERAPWTDEHLNPTSPPDKFQLPDIEGGHAEWQWVPNSQWRVELPPAPSTSKDQPKPTDDDAWVYYDNKWLNGTRNQDGWSKYTRRRKWIRDAELVDTSPTIPTSPDPPGNSRDGNPPKRAAPLDFSTSDPNSAPRPDLTSARSTRSVARKNLSVDEGDPSSDGASFMSSPPDSARSGRAWFGRSRGESDTLSVASTSEGRMRDRLRKLSPARKIEDAKGRLEDAKGRLRGASASSVTLITSREGRGDAGESVRSGKSGSVGSGGSERRRDEGMDVWTPTERLKERHADWGLGEDVSMELG